MLGNYANLCRWSNCWLLFPNAEQLYDHLCEDHVGRKITSNLCLACKWKDCKSSYTKRDHITSHLRVHTQQKPYCCPFCRKSFKRIQDSRKHEKIHTAEHRFHHTRSKTPRLADFAYIRRAENGDDYGSASEVTIPRLPSRASSSSSVAGHSHPSPSNAPVVLYHVTLDPFLSSVPREETLLPGQVVSITHDVPRPTSPSPSHQDYNVLDFLIDIKQHQLNPFYDCRMAKRLDSLVYLHQKNSGSFSSSSLLFSAPHIETMEEISSLTQFLVNLGKDIEMKESGSPTRELPHDLEPCCMLDFGGTASTASSFFLHPPSLTKVSGGNLHECLHHSTYEAALKSRRPYSPPPLASLNLSLFHKDGDARYKLPPLTGNASGADTKKLPGIHEITSRIRNEERRRSHAKIIGVILTFLNNEVKRRHGRTTSKPSCREYM